MDEQSASASREMSLPELCYAMAYYVLPHYVFNDIAKLIDRFQKAPNSVGAFFYLIAAQMGNVEPNRDDVRRFRSHSGQRRDGGQYFILEYPTPPPVDLYKMTQEEISVAATSIVLAPYFSAILPGTESTKASYFILGQAAMGGGTNLRCIEQTETSTLNCNLGPGPEPVLSAFLEELNL